MAAGDEARAGEGGRRAFRGAMFRTVRRVGMGIGLVLLLAAAGVAYLTQTSFGRAHVASFLEGRIEAALRGDVEIGRILGGNLLTRVTTARFAIHGPDGELFVSLDTVRLEYDPTGFLRGNFAFRSMSITRGRLLLHQDEGGTWNYERIFPEGEDEEPGGIRLAATNVRLGTGRLEVRMPWAADLSGAERESALAQAARGETVWHLERDAEGRWEQVIAVDSLRGDFPLLRLADPRLPMAISVREARGTLRAVREPLEVLRFDGGATFGDSIRVRLDRLRLPASRVSGEGWVLPGDPQEYRFDLAADPAGFSDLQWLPVPVPREGGGPMRIVFRSSGETPVVEVRDGRARVRDSELEGSFTLALEEVPRFEELEARFRPLRLPLVWELLERPEGMDASVTGTLRGQGPIDLLGIDADATLRDPQGVLAPSRVRARGGVALDGSGRMRDLRLDLSGFDPGWIALAGPEPELGGTLDGFVVLDGRAGGPVSFTADLAHTRPDGALSRVSGGGTVDPGPRRVDVRLSLDPLALAIVDPYVPDLRLIGAVRGTVAASGTLADLRAEADLRTPRGELTFDGTFDLEAERKRYDAAVAARGIDLRQWSERWPETSLAVRGRVTGEGTDPADLRARFDLTLLPSRVDEARVDTSLVRFTAASGLATVDTFHIRTDVGQARGTGGFGLAAGESGALFVDVLVPDLSRWNRWLIPGRSGAAEPEEGPEDLFAAFPGEPGERPDAPPEAGPDTLSGSLVARGALYGNLEEVSFGGLLRGRALSYGSHSADSLSATLDVADPRTRDSVIVNVSALDVRIAGQALDALTARVERRGGPDAGIRLSATRDTTLAVELAGEGVWTEERRGIELRRLELLLGGQQLALDGTASVRSDETGLVVRGLTLTGPAGALVSASGAVPERGGVELDVELRQVRADELLRSMGGPDLGGTLGGSLRVRGTAESPEMEAEIGIARPRIGRVVYSRLDGEFRYEDRRTRGSVVLEGEAGPLVRAEGTLRADLSFRDVEDRIPEDAFDFRIVAERMPLQLVELATESLRDVQGTLEGEVFVTGAPGAMEVDGEARLVGASARIPSLGLRFPEIAGAAAFRGSGARVDSLVVVSPEGGRLHATGAVGLAQIRDPAFDLQITVRRFRPVDRRTMSFLATGSLDLRGSYRSPVLTGRVRAFNGNVREEEFMRGQDVIDLTDPRVWALLDTTLAEERRVVERIRNPFMENLRLDLQMDVGPDLWLRSRQLDVEVAGEGLDVQMDRGAESIVLVGTLRLTRGTYRFEQIPPYSQQLRIVGGRIEFVGSPEVNPNLEITAVYRARTEQGPVSIEVVIGGTRMAPTLVLQSDPPLSESDQLCFLAVGSPCFQAVDQRLGERLVRESILGTLSTGLGSALVSDVGLDYFALRSSRGAGTGEEGLFSRQGLFAGAELEIGKYLGSDLFVTVTQPFGSRYPGWTIEWRFAEDWTLEARAENRFARRFGAAATSSLELDQTYGLLLFREWSF